MNLTKDDLKALKREHAKRVNAEQKAADKDFNKIEKVIKAELEKRSRGDEQFDILFSFVLGRFIFENRFTEEAYHNILKVENASIKESLLTLWYKHYPEMMKIRKESAYMEVQHERLGYLTGIKKTVQLYKTQENEKQFTEFLNDLEYWTPAENKDGKLVVNGYFVEQDTICGVKIGNGKRIHLMKVRAETIQVKNRKGELEDVDVISCWNGTRWNNSSIQVIDIQEKIPTNILSKIS